jgi:hypothetical protein
LSETPTKSIAAASPEPTPWGDSFGKHSAKGIKRSFAGEDQRGVWLVRQKARVLDGISFEAFLNRTHTQPIMA